MLTGLLCGGCLSKGLRPFGLGQESFAVPRAAGIALLTEGMSGVMEPAAWGKPGSGWPVQGTLLGRQDRQSRAFSCVMAFTGLHWENWDLPFLKGRQAHPAAVPGEGSEAGMPLQTVPSLLVCRLPSSCGLTLVFGLWNGLHN